MVEFLESRELASRSIRNQVLRSGTSIGANLEEAVASESRRDFVHKNSIALKQARETNYWLRILTRVLRCDSKTRKCLVGNEREAAEIMKILGKIVSKSKKSV